MNIAGIAYIWTRSDSRFSRVVRNLLSHDIPQSKNKVENGPYWGEDSEKPANKLEDRLSLAFNVECFVSPPNSDSAHKAGIQTTRFPTVLQCPKTGELFDVRELEREKSYYTDKSSLEERTVDETFTGYRSPSYDREIYSCTFCDCD